MSRRLQTLLFLLPLVTSALAASLVVLQASPIGGGPSDMASMAPFGDVARAPDPQTADLE
jgi:hypothetical protein